MNLYPLLWLVAGIALSASFMYIIPYFNFETQQVPIRYENVKHSTNELKVPETKHTPKEEINTELNKTSTKVKDTILLSQITELTNEILKIKNTTLTLHITGIDNTTEIPTIYFNERDFVRIKEFSCHNGSFITFQNRKLFVVINQTSENNQTILDQSSLSPYYLEVKLSQSLQKQILKNDSQSNNELQIFFNYSVLLNNPTSKIFQNAEFYGDVEDNGLYEMDALRRTHLLKLNAYCNPILPLNALSSDSRAKKTVKIPALSQVMGIIKSKDNLIYLNYNQVASVGLESPFPIIEVEHASNYSTKRKPEIDKIYTKVGLFGSPEINGSNFGDLLGSLYHKEITLHPSTFSAYQKLSSQILKQKKKNAKEEELMSIYYHSSDYYKGDLGLPSDGVFVTSALSTLLKLQIGDYVVLKSTISHETYLLKQQIIKGR